KRRDGGAHCEVGSGPVHDCRERLEHAKRRGAEGLKGLPAGDDVALLAESAVSQSEVDDGEPEGLRDVGAQCEHLGPDEEEALAAVGSLPDDRIVVTEGQAEVQLAEKVMELEAYAARRERTAVPREAVTVDPNL